MKIKTIYQRLKNNIASQTYKFQNSQKTKFECPICNYKGPFMDITPTTGVRKHAKCPNCKALERHRMQFIALNQVLQHLDTGSMKILHFAPEPFFQEYFKAKFGQYESADISMKGVDHKVDLQDLPFDDDSYNFVFASHVLEHIPNDNKAISEIRRILKPNGIAILPVPIVAEKTIEYSKPNPHESNHVRAPGKDYFDRYEKHFRKTELISSDSHPEKHQLYIFEDRSQRPTKQNPLLSPVPGEKHIDIVPVCYA